MISSNVPDLQDPIPVFKLIIILMIHSFSASFLSFFFATILSLIILTFFILTFFDLKPKHWDGSSAQKEFIYPWSTRLFLIYLIIATLVSSFVSEEYSDSIFISHLICFCYPLLAVFGVIGFCAQVQIQSSFSHDRRYQRISKHED